MGTLNAAPDQNPFAFECSQDYRTAAMRFKTSGQNCREQMICPEL
jgi:hypothetical protein